MAWLAEVDLYNDSQSKEKKMTKLHFTFALGVLLSAGAFAQEPPPPPGQIGFAYQGGDFVFMRTEGAMEKTLKAVKNSPYSAQSMTEFTQKLADGNRIQRTTNGIKEKVKAERMGSLNAVEKGVLDKASAEMLAKMKVRANGLEPNSKTEDHGTQVMEGVTVQGKRATRTIPAGEIGNERPLEILTETWFSP